ATPAFPSRRLSFCAVPGLMGSPCAPPLTARGGKGDVYPHAQGGVTMQPNQQSQSRERIKVVVRPRCLACGGEVYELRGYLRWVRCHLMLCESCGGADPDEGVGEE